jgi:hypothetical protein
MFAIASRCLTPNAPSAAMTTFTVLSPFAPGPSFKTGERQQAEAL